MKKLLQSILGLFKKRPPPAVGPDSATAVMLDALEQHRPLRARDLILTDERPSKGV